MPIYWDEQKSIKRPTDSRPRIFIRATCERCGKERWLIKENIRAKRFTGLCEDCIRTKRFGPAHPNWKGGRILHDHGYVGLTIPPDHPFASMRNSRGEIYEHRLRMAEQLGRPLASYEHVHHKNGNRQDNRLSNLELVSTQQNHLFQALQARILELESHIAACCGHKI